MSQPVVTIISLGGTIASVSDETGLAGPRLSAADLVSVLPQLGEMAQVEVRDLARLPSCDMSFRLGRDVAAEIAEAAARGSTGIVVTQGTDTIEELSFCLDLLVRTDTPLAVVGAMRHAGLPGMDGAANLLDAVRTVLSPAAVGLGCLVVMNEQIHSARAVRKLHTTSPSAFSSGEVGPLGWIAEGSAHLRDRPYPRITLSVPDEAEVPRPPLVRITMDDDGWWLPAIREMNPPGLVIDAMGGGHVPGWLSDDLLEIAQRVPVVLTSRTGRGEVLTQTYGGFPGSESTLVSGGVIPGGTLDGLKARVLLALLLATGADRSTIHHTVSKLGTLHRSAARG
jgi:L-asparaginase